MFIFVGVPSYILVWHPYPRVQPHFSDDETCTIKILCRNKKIYSSDQIVIINDRTVVWICACCADYLLCCQIISFFLYDYVVKIRPPLCLNRYCIICLFGFISSEMRLFTLLCFRRIKNFLCKILSGKPVAQDIIIITPLANLLLMHHICSPLPT